MSPWHPEELALVTDLYELTARGQRLRGVRIDSGDLLTLSREVRPILDEAGLHEVQLIGSGGLDK